MEAEVGALYFPDFSNQTPRTTSRTMAHDVFLSSSWLDFDDGYTPDIPFEFPDPHMFNDKFSQFGNSSHFGSSSTTAAGTAPSFLQQPSPGCNNANFGNSVTGLATLENFNEETILLNLSKFDLQLASPEFDEYHPILPETYFSSEPPETYFSSEPGCNSFLNEDMCLNAPVGSHDTFVDPLVTSSTSSSTTSSSEKSIDRSNLESGNVSVTQLLAAAAPLSGEEEEEVDGTDNDPKPGILNCKNLVSERNRRKRLSQQLLALRALVPNITKMDKRSVLVDALAYLRSIHEETARIQAEIKEGGRNNRDAIVENAPDSNPPRRTLPPRRSSRPKAQILEIDAEKIEERRFVVKIRCKGGAGVGGEILRVIESLGFEITYSALEQSIPHHMLTTVFIRVRRQGRMTEEKLKDCIRSTALRSGLNLQNP